MKFAALVRASKRDVHRPRGGDAGEQLLGRLKGLRVVDVPVELEHGPQAPVGRDAAVLDYALKLDEDALGLGAAHHLLDDDDRGHARRLPAGALLLLGLLLGALLAWTAVVVLVIALARRCAS